MGKRHHPCVTVARPIEGRKGSPERLWDPPAAPTDALMCSRLEMQQMTADPDHFNKHTNSSHNHTPTPAHFVGSMCWCPDSWQFWRRSRQHFPVQSVDTERTDAATQKSLTGTFSSTAATVLPLQSRQLTELQARTHHSPPALTFNPAHHSRECLAPVLLTPNMLRPAKLLTVACRAAHGIPWGTAAQEVW